MRSIFSFVFFRNLSFFCCTFSTSLFIFCRSVMPGEEKHFPVKGDPLTKLEDMLFSLQRYMIELKRMLTEIIRPEEKKQKPTQSRADQEWIINKKDSLCTTWIARDVRIHPFESLFIYFDRVVLYFVDGDAAAKFTCDTGIHANPQFVEIRAPTHLRLFFDHMVANTTLPVGDEHVLWVACFPSEDDEDALDRALQIQQQRKAQNNSVQQQRK